MKLLAQPSLISCCLASLNPICPFHFHAGTTDRPSCISMAPQPDSLPSWGGPTVQVGWSKVLWAVIFSKSKFRTPTSLTYMDYSISALKPKKIIVK